MFVLEESRGGKRGRLALGGGSGSGACSAGEVRVSGGVNVVGEAGAGGGTGGSAVFRV